jgi:hypothetical protein
MFINPWYLALLPLAALPVIIHMIHRQKYRIFDFSTLLFFDRSRKYNVFRMRLRHLLLMCLRIAAVLFIVVAFSRVVFTGLGIGDRQQAVVLVLDGSCSMTRRFGEETAFDFARRQALKSLEEAGPSAMAGVVTTHPTPRLVLRPSSDAEAFRQAVQGLQPFFREGSSWAAVRLAQSALKPLRASSRQVVVFTDFQSSAWSEEAAGRASDKAEDRKPGPGEALADDIPVRFVVLRPRTENCAIVGLDVQQAPVTVGRPARFAPTIRNFTDKEVKGLKIAAGLGPGNEEEAAGMETLQLDLPPFGTVRVNFFFTFSMPGPQGVWFRIDDDALPADNRWHEAVSVLDTTPVLCLGSRPTGKEGETKAADDLFYLSNALAPAGKSNNVSLVVSPVSQLLQTGLYGYHCVFLPAVKELGEKEARLLCQYVSRGGGLVVFLGADTDEASLRLLLGTGEAGPLIPAEVKGIDKEPARIVSVDFHGSPAVGELAHLADELKGVSYTARYQLSLGKQGKSPASPLALFSDGSPAIVEARFGFGRCVLFAGGCCPPGTDIPFRAIFPTLVQDLARRLGQPGRETVEGLRPSDAFAASFEEAERPKHVTISTPDRGPQAASKREGENSFGLWFSGTSAPGYYQVQAAYGEDERETAIHAFSVNVGGDDSDLRPADPDRVKAVHPNLPVSVHSVAKPILHPGLLATDRRDMMRLLLLAVLILVIAENIVSWLTK